MIGKLKGLVTDFGKNKILIETSAGVSYMVEVGEKCKSEIMDRKECEIYTHTMVRKDTIDIYGFVNYEDYTNFLLLISVNGVGAKKALGIIEETPKDVLISAIAKEDVNLLVSFGTNKKLAQKIIIDLNKKITTKDVEVSNDLVVTFISLGYSKKEVVDAIKECDLKELKIEDQIKKVLKVIRG